MPTIPRVAYFAQSGTITADGNVYVLPISSANIEVTRPIEAVTTFGQFTALNTAQTNITTCKSTLKAYLGTGNGINGLTKTVLDQLISSTQTGSIEIKVSPNGFTMTGILTNIGLDISLGGFGMCDLGFAGVGNPNVTSPIATTAAASTALTISPVTTMTVGSGQALSGVYATSIKFSYDLPTDTLGALGENPNATQGSMISTIATKAPYKTSIAIEGYGVNISGLLDTAVTGVYSIGNIGISLPKAKVSSRSFNNAAGQVSATFSLSAEDTSATFSVIIPSGYSQNFDQSSLPMYGG